MKVSTVSPDEQASERHLSMASAPAAAFRGGGVRLGTLQQDRGASPVAHRDDSHHQVDHTGAHCHVLGLGGVHTSRGVDDICIVVDLKHSQSCEQRPRDMSLGSYSRFGSWAREPGLWHLGWNEDRS